MFILKLYDRLGNELQLGDIVRISNGKAWNFYAEVTYLPDGAIAPFHTFCFHSFEKVDKLPDGAVKSSETHYNIWYKPSDELNGDDDDLTAEKYENYLSSWRSVEHWIEKECFRIYPMQNVNNSHHASLTFPD